jgi:hypothetical protein
MRNRGKILYAMLSLCFVAACASTAPPLRDDRTAVVPGRETADLKPDEARRAVLLEAARVTVDHGYQYFSVLRRDVWTPSGTVHAGTDSAIRPGDDVTIKVFHDGEISPGARDVFDAQRLLTGGAAQAQANAPVYVLPPSYSPSSQQPGAPRPTPRCTAYGCTW